MRKILFITTLLVSLAATAQHQFVQRQFMQGIKPPLVVDAGGWLKFDGVNDYATFNDNSFYNLSGKDFTFIFRVIVMRVGSGSGSRVLQLLGKGIASVDPTYYYLIGTASGTNQSLAFRFGYQGTTYYRAVGVPTDTFNIENNLGKIYTFCYRRLSGVYNIYINGVKHNCQTLLSAGVLPGDPFGNVYSANINNPFTGAGQSRMYFNKFLFYDRGLSDAEIAAHSFDTPNELNLKQALYFDAKTDSIVKDYSSVANNAVLKNYTDTELGIPTASTNTAWISDVVPFNANTTTTWTAPKAIVTTKFRRGFTTVMNFTIVHKRAGVTLATHSDIFTSGSQADIAITMEQGDVLEIDPSSTGSYLGAFEIFY